MENNKTKIEVIVDSFSSTSITDVNNLGLHFVGLTVELNGKTYTDDGIEISSESISQMKYDDASTSQPPQIIIEEKMEELSKKAEHVVYLPINSKISSTYSSAMVVSRKFDNVHVIDNCLTGSGTISAALHIKEMVNNGKTMDDVHKFVKKISNELSLFILPLNNDRIIKSGRVTGLKKLFLRSTKFKPLLNFTLNGFSSGGLKKTTIKSVRLALTKTLDKIKSLGKKNEDYDFMLIHSGTEQEINEAKLVFKELGIESYKEEWTTAVVIVHTGNGAMGIGAFPKIEKMS